MNKPVLSKQAFWDVDMDQIDYEKDMLAIFEKVMYRGTPDDFFTLAKFYGDERIRKEIIHTKNFGPKEINFCCIIFKMEPDDFIYHRIGQSKIPPEFIEKSHEFDYYN